MLYNPHQVIGKITPTIILKSLAIELFIIEYITDII